MATFETRVFDKHVKLSNVVCYVQEQTNPRNALQTFCMRVCAILQAERGVSLYLFKL